MAAIASRPRDSASFSGAAGACFWDVPPPPLTSNAAREDECTEFAEKTIAICDFHTSLCAASLEVRPRFLQLVVLRYGGSSPVTQSGGLKPVVPAAEGPRLTAARTAPHPAQSQSQSGFVPMYYIGGASSSSTTAVAALRAIVRHSSRSDSVSWSHANISPPCQVASARRRESASRSSALEVLENSIRARFVSYGRSCSSIVQRSTSRLVTELRPWPDSARKVH